jgi:DNA polymerase-3 subunit alpha
LILKFAEYGFAKAHAVSYAMISYQLAYIKAHYKVNFMENMLNHVIGSIKDTKDYITECKENNIHIINPNINQSGDCYIIQENSLLYPLINIKNVSLVATSHIIEKRNNAPFKDIFDFIKRVDKKIINRQVIEYLIYAGAFDSLGLNRKTLIENLDILLNYGELLEDLSEEFAMCPEIIEYEEYSSKELMHFEYEALGFYLNQHPVNEYRKKLNQKISLNSISNYMNRNITVIARIDELKEIRTKNNQLICFMKISDEYTSIEAPIFYQAYQNCPTIKEGDIIKIYGRTNRRNGKDQLIVSRIDIIDSI